MTARVFIGLILLFPFLGIGQEGILPLDHFVTTKAEILMKSEAVSVHPELKPYSFWTIQANTLAPDSVSDFELLALKREKSSYFKVSPLIGIVGYNQGGSSFKQGIRTFGGLGVGMGFKNKVYLHADGILAYSNPPTYMTSIADSLWAIPGFGYVSPSRISRPGYDYDQLSVVLAVKPSPYFEVFAGRGKHFIGEGYRSMFLSDFSANFNYLRTDVSVWKLKYMVLYAQMNQSYDYPNRFYPTSKKYSTMHYLSLNLTDWWSVGAFEAIVWEAEDSVINRRFDFNYVNPLIFFRPVEYGIGSSDNSLLGFSSTIRPTKGLTLYGQILLDEFVFNEWNAPIRARLSDDPNIKTGWWANKQAYQLGVKYHEPFGWKNGSALAEVNVVRPFTYGHSNRSQSYTHLNMPMAHPLGANFIEWVQVTTWQPGKLELGLFTTYSRKGYSNQIGFMGEDILVSNVARDDDRREHGNFMLQGKKVDVANIRLLAGYTLIENWNLKAEASIHYRLQRTAVQTEDMILIGFGVRTALWNNYENL